MSAPFIGDVNITPDPVPAGQQAAIMVVASDPDARQISAEAAVVDAAGHVDRKAFTFKVSDALTYTVSVDVGVVAQDPSDPAVFVWSPMSTE